ncbi:MAG TPA: HEAT repeat domain-containing protein [Pyrinomonadaceae bacterium]|jgi:HEAT repeat protein
MSNTSPSTAPAQHKPASIISHTGTLARASSLTLLLALLALKPSDSAQAQQKAKEAPLSITEINARPTRNGTVVSVMADAPLTRTQSWSDGEGFHLIFPYAGRSPVKRLPRGVKVRRLDRSMEIVVPVTSGSSVTVEPRFNRLNLVVQGQIDSSQAGTDEQLSAASMYPEPEEEPRAYAPRAQRESLRRTSEAPIASSPLPSIPRAQSTQSAASSSQTTGATSSLPSYPAPLGSIPSTSSSGAPVTTTSSTAKTPTTLVPVQEDVPVNGATTLPSPEASPSPAAETPQEEQPGLLARLFSGATVAILLALGLITLIVVRLRRPAAEDSAAEKASEQKEEKTEEKPVSTALAVAVPQAQATSAPSTPSTVSKERRVEQRRRGERKWWGRRNTDLPARLAKASAASPTDSHEKGETRALMHAPSTAMFGAYRVDQEVGKLLLGQPHRMDVLASRAPDDRRAVETSLVKVLHAPDADMESRRRAREALEDYGFVARLSAALLLAPQAYERAAAARTLGEIEALSSLPFLMEALYDAEPIVRTQAVTSIGALKQPAAIGALLDMARRHPEMPASLLSRVLSACSLDCLDLGEPLMLEPETSGAHAPSGPFTGEITKLETSVMIEELPESLDDEHLAEALAALESEDAEARKTAARHLAQYQVQCSVMGLSAVAARDGEPSVRAAAITSLGDINHESVFAAVLVAFADEAREVRAAAARALSHLSFDRADAYVRLLDTASPEMLREVARACIKGGMAVQAIDRLASEDRRQAYESFSLLSMLAKSNETEPIVDAIVNHKDYNVRLAAVRLLGLSGSPEIVQQLRHLAVKDGLPEKLRTALLEVVYKIDQALPV